MHNYLQSTGHTTHTELLGWSPEPEHHTPLTVSEPGSRRSTAYDTYAAAPSAHDGAAAAASTATRRTAKAADTPAPASSAGSRCGHVGDSGGRFPRSHLSIRHVKAHDDDDDDAPRRLLPPAGTKPAHESIPKPAASITHPPPRIQKHSRRARPCPRASTPSRCWTAWP